MNHGKIYKGSVKNMEKRILGKTGIITSSIGCGGIPIQRATINDAKEIVLTLKSLGINFIDTARGYTNSESLFGCALKNLRNDFIIASKSMARDYENMKKDIDISLSSLQTNYIDLYQCHNVSNYNDIKGALLALNEAKREGKIHHIGITSHNLEIIKRAVDDDIFSTIQFPYNVLETQAEEVFKKAKEKNIGVIVMKPFAGGAINDHELALRFILNNPNISVVIPGMESKKQVLENGTVEKKELSIRDITRIKEIRQDLNSEFCRRCGYCMPCTVGIDIPSCFLFAAYDKRYNLKDWARNRYEKMNVFPSECIECHQCETRCPYQLKIVDKLKDVVKLFNH